MACFNSMYQQGREIPGPAVVRTEALAARAGRSRIAGARLRTRPGRAGLAGDAVRLESVGAALTEACTDYRGTRLYNAGERDPFWPFFAHPRWLSCDELYCKRR